MTLFLKILAASIFLFLYPSFGQQANLKIGKIGLEQGLSQSSIYAVAQDALGFMWFGTQDGLNRYDGYSVKVFKFTPGIQNSVSDNTIMSLLNDSKGNLWIGTMNGGVDKYIPSENKFYNYSFADTNSGSLSSNDITDIFEDSRGNIWIGTRDHGLNLFNQTNGYFTRFINNKNIAASLAGNSVKSICEDESGSLWVATNKGISKITENNNSYSFKNYFMDLNDNGIKTIFIDSKNILWIGTWGSGLIRYDIKEGESKLHTHNVNSPGSLSSNFIQAVYEDLKGNLLIATHNAGVQKYISESISFEKFYDVAVLSFFEDRSGILWLGTFINGVLTFDNQRNRFRHYYNDPDNPDDLNDDFVYTILQDRDGDLWVRSFKDGLNRFNSTRSKVTNYNFDNKNLSNPGNNRIVSLSESSDGSIWIGTQKGELYKLNKHSEKFKRYANPRIEEITVIFEDSKGILWIGNNKGELYNFNHQSGNFSQYYPGSSNSKLISGRITTVFEDSKEGLWVGTLRDGLYYLLPGTGAFNHFSASDRSLNSSSVLCVYEDSSGMIWIGTLAGGLNKFDPESGRFEYFTELEGLPNNVVYGILPGNDGNLWLSTNKGISRFDRTNKSFRNFDAKDGLQGDEFNNGSYFAGRNGELFFGGTNGFNSFFPENIIENDFIPPVHITSMKVFDEEVPLTGSSGEIELSYTQNFFSFEFVALNYTLSEKNQYAYMLEGFDKKWHYVSAGSRNASYTNINPGRYILRVKGSNNDGIWNEEGTTLILTITPPFWMTWWFRSIAFLFIAGIIILAYNYRVSQLINIERIRMRIASDLHDEIGSSLGSIVLRSRVMQKHPGLPENSKQELGRINRTAMQTSAMMRDIVWFINPDFDTLDDMILRMKDTTQMFLCDIPYDFIAPDEILSVKLSLEFRRNIFLCYKEILHNIAKHSRASEAVIKITIVNKNFELKISDNGIGFDHHNVEQESKHKAGGNGLRNIEKRIERINGEVKVNSVPGKGTVITIKAKTT